MCGDTFANIAKVFFQANPMGAVRKIHQRSGAQQVLSYAQLANHLQCQDMAYYSREAVAKYAMRVVWQFCLSDDPAITAAHVQKVFFSKSPEEQLLMLNISQYLWELILNPRGFFIPIRHYHLVKAYALTGLGISNKYQYVVVDETHHLSPVVLQILRQSPPQPVFTFGDRYQALDGDVSPKFLEPTLRRRSLTHSIRAGANLDGLYNSTLKNHPISPENEFSGNKTKKTKLITYKNFTVPTEYCSILAKSTWSIFYVAYELQQKSASYHILSRTKADINRLVDAAYSFYAWGSKPGHYEFSNSHSWDDFVEKNKLKEPALTWIDRLLRKGFSGQQLKALLNDSTSQPQQNVYILGRVADCRNMEFDRVLLLNDIIGDSGVINDNHAKTVSHIYTGISRAKHKLHIPDSITDWLEFT